jgi:ankyrin repeat protein
MPPPAQSLADLYSEEALQVLLETAYQGFHALVYRAARRGDFDFLERALQVTDPKQVQIGPAVRKFGSYLSVTTGAGDLFHVSDEPLFSSFLRGLHAREFGTREQQFLDSLLSKAKAGSKIEASAVYSDALMRLLAFGECAPAQQHLVNLGIDAFSLPTSTQIKVAGRSIHANPLGVAILSGNEPVFSALISNSAANARDSARPDWETAPVIHVDPTSKHSSEELTTLDAILFLAEKDLAPKLLEIYERHAPLSTPKIDKALLTYLARARVGENKVVEQDEYWSRPLDNTGWTDEAIDLMLSRRDSTQKFESKLLVEAMHRACYPVLDAAIESGQNDLTDLHLKGIWEPVNCVKTVVSSPSPLDRMSRALALVLSAGADVNQYSNDTTALIDAAKNGQLEIAGLLLQHGADPDAKDGRNWTARSSFKDLAMRQKFDQLVAVSKAQRSIGAVLQGRLAGQP